MTSQERAWLLERRAELPEDVFMVLERWEARTSATAREEFIDSIPDEHRDLAELLRVIRAELG